MNKQKILVVDDEQHIVELLQFNLEQAGYQVYTALSGEEAVKTCEARLPDLVLLDLMLPGIDGLEVCRQLKKNPQTSAIPIIMLTAKGDEIDKVLGLELGADDYIVKPFGIRETLARVKALLRRSNVGAREERPKLIHAGELTMDTEKYVAMVNGQNMILTLKEFELLRLLLQNAGKVLTRDMLLDQIWGYEYYGETRTVDVHIRHLRQKLGEEGQHIQTLRGVGYKWDGPVT